MLVRSATLTNLSGSLAGITAARNRGGAYLRNRTTPVNPNTGRQVNIRQAFRDAVVAWTETLTGAQRQSWADYAANVQVKNRLGESINLTGQNWYVACSVPRRQAVLQNAVAIALTDPAGAPVVFDRGTLPTLTISATAAELEFEYDTIPGGTAQDVLLVFVSKPVNPTVNFFSGPYQLIGSIAGNAASPATVAFPAGFEPATGARLFVRTVMSRADGRLTSPIDTIVEVA